MSLIGRPFESELATDAMPGDLGSLCASELPGNSFRPRSLLSNAAWNLLLTVWTTGVTFLLTPFLILRLGEAYYGVFVLLMSVCGLLMVMNLGLGEATVRYVSHYAARNDLVGINRVIGATLSVYTVMAVIGGIGVAFGAPLLVRTLAIPSTDYDLGIQLLRLVAISFAINLIGGVYGAIPQALQRFDVSTKLAIFQSVFQFSGTLVILLRGGGVYGLMLWSVVTSIATQAASFFAVKVLLPRVRVRPSPSLAGLKEVLSYGVFSLVTLVLGLVWSQADRLLLGTMVSAAAVAYLTVPHTLVFRIASGVNATACGLFPRFSATTDRAEMYRLFVRSTWVLLAATISVFVPLTVLIPDFLRLWVSREFAAHSAWVGQIIAISCIVRGAFEPYAALFKGIGKPSYLALLFTATSLTSLIANVILIPRYGLSGAGYSYAITPVWGFAAIVFAWKRVLHRGSMLPLVRHVALPIGVGFTLLVVAHAIRAHIRSIGWVGLIGLGSSFCAGTLVVLAVVDWVTGPTSSCAAAVWKRLQHVARPLWLSHPAPAWERAHADT